MTKQMTRIDGSERRVAAADVWNRRMGGLMVAAQAGDRASYTALLGECLTATTGAAVSAGIRGPSLERFIRATLTTVHHARHTYEPTRSFHAWLDAIARGAFASVATAESADASAIRSAGRRRGTS